jgi:hypothetical protein
MIDIEALASEAGIRKEMWMTNPPKFASCVGPERALAVFANAVLEAAARKCDDVGDHYGPDGHGEVADHCAILIRAQKVTP